MIRHYKYGRVSQYMLARYQQFVAAEGRGKPTVKQKTKKRKHSTPPKHDRQRASRLKRDPFLAERLAEHGDKDYRTWVLPMCYRFVQLRRRHPTASPSCCWKLAGVLEQSECEPFDADEAKDVCKMLKDSDFAVYGPTAYDTQKYPDDRRMYVQMDQASRGLPPPPPSRGVKILGEGAFGVVTQMKAGDGSSFARKTLREDTTYKNLDGCVREIALMHALQGSPHIAQLQPWAAQIEYKDGRITACTFDMEMATGSLFSYLRDPGWTSSDQRRDIVCQIAAGIKACHDVQIVHRDLKPDNVLLFQNAAGKLTAKLTDFGAARRLSACRERKYSVGMCTGWWRAPELWDAHVREVSDAHYDLKVDVFSFGIVMCDILYTRGTLYVPYAFEAYRNGVWPEKWELKRSQPREQNRIMRVIRAGIRLLGSADTPQLWQVQNEEGEPIVDQPAFVFESERFRRTVNLVEQHNRQVDICWRDFMRALPTLAQGDFAELGDICHIMTGCLAQAPARLSITQVCERLDRTSQSALRTAATSSLTF